MHHSVVYILITRTLLIERHVPPNLPDHLTFQYRSHARSEHDNRQMCLTPGATFFARTPPFAFSNGSPGGTSSRIIFPTRYPSLIVPDKTSRVSSRACPGYAKNGPRRRPPLAPQRARRTRNSPWRKATRPSSAPRVVRTRFRCRVPLVGLGKPGMQY